MQSANAAAHCTGPDCLLPSTMETRIFIWPVSRLSSFPFYHSKLLSPQASGYKQNEHNQMSLQIIPFVLYSDKSENGTRCSLLFSPCVSLYWQMNSMFSPPALNRKNLWLQNISTGIFCSLSSSCACGLLSPISQKGLALTSICAYGLISLSGFRPTIQMLIPLHLRS